MMIGMQHGVELGHCDDVVHIMPPDPELVSPPEVEKPDPAEKLPDEPTIIPVVFATVDDWLLVTMSPPMPPFPGPGPGPAPPSPP